MAAPSTAAGAAGDSERRRAATTSSPQRRGRGVLTAAVVCVTVAVLAQLPLVGNRVFYYWDDSSSQFLPMWYRLGQDLAHGHWPPLLAPESWMGGNIAAEALFGTYNPVNLANYLLTAALPDLAVAAALIKTEFLVLLALGTYLLCREYGALRHASAAMAIALPFAGMTLYFDASAWAAGLMAFTYTPYVWWAVRRAASGRLNPLWAFLIGALAVTCGNPYGLLGVGVVVIALLAEFAVRRQWPAWRLTLVLGVLIGLVAPLVYLPLLGTAPVTWREIGTVNSGFLTLSASDVLGSSSPTLLPPTRIFTGFGTAVPAAYFAWFTLPLLPWLDFRVLKPRLRLLTGAFVVAGVYLLLTLGPSNLWMFRWPFRLAEYCYLGFAVPLAILLSTRLLTTHFRVRAAGSAAILLAGAYLAWAASPQRWAAHLGALCLVAALTAAALWAHERGRNHFTGALAAGTAAVLGLQLGLFPANVNLTQFRFPHSVQDLKSRFAGRYTGETFQIASIDVARDTVGLHPGGAWRDFLFGNAYLPAGVDSVVSYSGMGFKDFSDTFCFNNSGSACPDAYSALWRPTGFGEASLADLMRVETVVVQDALVPGVSARPGWHVAEKDGVATVLRRDHPVPWPAGRLGWASPDLLVLTDRSGGRQETLSVTSRGDGPRQLVFARLAWPGYRAELNGKELPVTTGPAGLVVVRLPAGSPGGQVTLHWTPPGLLTGFVFAAVGALGALLLGAWSAGLLFRRRED
ncbi:hypothetical protein ORV05_02175 [Amycolatopsis cynarae]|uniref:YfhO family protein n=1 Tax=Amycolatopsis cynarae TaxID=2995223 RepID=A0ABY7B6Z4_9PSEU|nr:hypothetical protein [Amycolatopsis sp. HUAS 11-8]WAL66646.1 hypothetical protein ORV05_02175 [Amycolatopsis sp. HUAS 11-8]